LKSLALITGKAHRLFLLPGQNNSRGACDMGLLPDYYPRYQEIGESREKFEAAWGQSLKAAPGLTFMEMLQAAHEGKIKALYVIGADPLASVASEPFAREALEKLDCLIVQDMFLSETAQLADIVLPAASFAETHGTFTNFEGKVGVVRPALEPLGESRQDWQIVEELAKRMGGEGFDYRVSSDILTEAQAQCSNRTEQRGGELIPLTCQDPPERADGEHPFLLVIDRGLYHASLTAKVEGLNELRPEELLEIGPADAATLDVKDGETVRVISQIAEATLPVKLTKTALPGVLSVTSHLPASPLNRFVGVAVGETSGSSESNLCAVRVEKLGDGSSG
jgi:predicted molibdopterin-dependent oxidoreductase YjgC